jgi:hypothetical protein
LDVGVKVEEDADGGDEKVANVLDVFYIWKDTVLWVATR